MTTMATKTTYYVEYNEGGAEDESDRWELIPSLGGTDLADVAARLAARVLLFGTEITDYRIVQVTAEMVTTHTTTNLYPRATEVIAWEPEP